MVAGGFGEEECKDGDASVREEERDCGRRRFEKKRGTVDASVREEERECGRFGERRRV